MKESGVFGKLSNTIVKHPKTIAMVWAAVLVMSIGVVLTQESTLSYDMTTMDLKETPDSVIGMQIIEKEFYNAPSASTMIVVKFDNVGDIIGFYPTFNAKVQAKYPPASVGDPPRVVVSETTPTPVPAADGNGYVSIYSITYMDQDIETTDQVPVIRDLVSKTIAESTISDDLTTYVTGNDAISYDTEASAMKDVEKIDPISILLILILIGLFFRSFVSSATPPLVVGGAYGVMLCMLFFLGGMMDIFYISPIILLVSMLGAGCDYSIFVIARYREERKEGLDKNDAVRESVKWAGESITTSGISVIIGFGVMSFCSFSMISSMGIVLALGIVVALLAALTLIPAILVLAGDRIFTPSKIETYQDGSKAMSGWYGNWSRRGLRYFRSTARHSMKYAKPIVIAAILFTVPMAYVMATEEGSYDMISTMPPGEAKEGVDVITETIGGGAMMPTYVVLEFTQPIATITHPSGPTPSWGTVAWDAGFMLEAARLLERDLELMTMDNVNGVLSVSMYSLMEIPAASYMMNGPAALPAIKAGLMGPPLNLDSATADAVIQIIVMEGGATLQRHPDLVPGTSPESDFRAAFSYDAYLGGFISENGMYSKTTVLMKDEPMSSTSMHTVQDLRAFFVDVVKYDPTHLLADAWVTGSVAVTLDISEIVGSEFTIIEIVVIIMIFLLLFFVMKSYLTPIRALATIIMSIVWTIGITHILFSWILGIPVLWMIPIILFVVCLGLGMDYDILLTTRIRESVVKGMTNDESIENALVKSGAVITICGLIMGGTFLTLTLSSTPMLQELGFALGFAILIDALIVRTYIVPAIMHLMGNANWIGPKWLGGKVSSKAEKKEPETSE